MKTWINICLAIICFSCHQANHKKTNKVEKMITAKEILGNPNYIAISYGGYRKESRDIQPTLAELKEDLKIMHAMGIRILRTYNVRLAHASNVLKAIRELKEEDASFKMYVMLGVWIDCKNAWTDQPVNHDIESEANATEIERAIYLASHYNDIVKVVAVGNEAMVKWAATYYVQADVILKWVRYLQSAKQKGKLSKDVWITSSDNFASWGGGEEVYHTEDLKSLIKEVDYISMHTYPMHDTHYNPAFWGVLEEEKHLSKEEQIYEAMLRARDYAISQYQSVKNYMESLGVHKPIHIGETGWATFSNGFYGNEGSKATDEYKEALYYKLMREWTAKEHISCFYFQAFDEPWKDAQNPLGSENHFGLFTVEGKAKYVIWDWVDKGVFKDLKRGGNPIVKTFNGDEKALIDAVQIPSYKHSIENAYTN